MRKTNRESDAKICAEQQGPISAQICSAFCIAPCCPPNDFGARLGLDTAPP